MPTSPSISTWMQYLQHIQRHVEREENYEPPIFDQEEEDQSLQLTMRDLITNCYSYSNDRGQSHSFTSTRFDRPPPCTTETRP